MNRMKTVLMTAAMLVCVFACTAVAGKTVYAAPNDTIQTGISADGMDLSGMTQEQAQGAVQSYVNELGQAQVQLQAQDGQSVSISLSELGISWKNPELVSEAVPHQIVLHILLILFLYIKEETIQGRSFINFFELIF